MTSDPVRIHYAPLATAMEELPEAICNRIRREHHQRLAGLHKGLPSVLRLTVRIAANTWNSIKFLTAESLDHGRRPEFAISVSPLARTLLDSLFTVVYLFDEPTENTKRFFSSGWREAHEHQVRLIAKHGGDPEWASWLADHGVAISGIAQDAELSASDMASPEKIKWWPNPGAMVTRSPPKDPVRQQYLGALNDWFYKHLSGDSHLSYLGLARRGGFFAEDIDDRATDGLSKYRSQVVLTSLTLFIALLSEVALAVDLPYEMERLANAWVHIRDWPEASDVFRKRYEQHLR